jgi:hypothetical protein
MDINAIDKRPIDRTLQDDTSAPPSVVPRPEPQISSAHERQLDDAALMYAQNRVPTGAVRTDATSTQPTPRFDGGVIYVGMNGLGGQDTREADNLMVAKTVIAHSERGPDGADHVRVGGTVVDLSTTEGSQTFAASLGLPKAQTDAVAKTLREASTGSRDELAGLATEFAKAERGQTIHSRLVLSGHCFGDGVWDGDHKLGQLQFQSVFSLADAMPKAAAHIQHVMLSACSTGYDGVPGKTSLGEWKSHFPNLLTAWGYDRPEDVHSPTEAHAVSHITAWEEHTRGNVQQLDGHRAVVETQRRHEEWKTPPLAAENVSTWTVSQGYRRGR